MRAVRATLVMPSLFALTAIVIDDPQMTLFAVFGSFATLVLLWVGEHLYHLAERGRRSPSRP
jgi:hypothetical protein